MNDLAEAVTVRKRRSRGRVIVSVTESIDDDELTAKAEERLLLAGDVDDDRVEATKQQLAERAVAKAVKQKAPEAFDPNTSVSFRVNSDRNLSPL